MNPPRFGIFVWHAEPRYRLSEAVRTFVSEAAANKYADMHVDRQYVVRDLRYVLDDTRKQNPAAPIRTTRADLTRAARRYQRFTGHADMTARRMVLPRMPRAVLTVGECDGILYTTVRDGRKESYIHRFAKGSRPLLTASPDGKRLYLLGGAYTFTNRGIVDKKR